MPGPEGVSREDLLALIVELRSVNVALTARVAEQETRIAAQDARIAVLERALLSQVVDVGPGRGHRAGGRATRPHGVDQLIEWYAIIVVQQ